MRRPEKKNALTPEMFVAMSEAINSAQSNPTIRCLILTGRSGAFTAGDDVGQFLKEATADRAAGKPRSAVAFVQSLIKNKKPIIAAVDGIAVGIGVTMVLHCDYVLAGTTSSFLYPFTRYGLAGVVNAVVPPGHAIVEAQKIAREICALPPEAVTISRNLLRLPAEEMLRRMDQEEHILNGRLRLPSVVDAVNNFLARWNR
jgi:enoyl-CoA hydratase/carnithine racemase